MKPFKETKLGIFLKEKAPHILAKIGDALPDAGLLGIIKNLVHDDPDMTPEMKLEYRKLEGEYQIQLLLDTQNARSRESEFIKATGHIDWFQTCFGATMALLFGYTIYISSTGEIPADMREIFIEGRAAVRDIVIAIAGYYWGSSAGSRVKDMKGK